MSSLISPKRQTRPIRSGAPVHREVATHLFSVGQTVRLRKAPGQYPTTGEIYRITATLPPQGNSPQYRIRSNDERHERVATQDSLERVR